MIGDNIKTIMAVWKKTDIAFGELMRKNKYKINSYKSEKARPDIDFMIDLEMITGISIKSLWRKKIDPVLVPEEPLSIENSPHLPYDAPDVKPVHVEELKEKYKSLPNPTIETFENHEFRIRHLESKIRTLELSIAELKEEE